MNYAYPNINIKVRQTYDVSLVIGIDVLRNNPKSAADDI